MRDEKSVDVVEEEVVGAVSDADNDKNNNSELEMMQRYRASWWVNLKVSFKMCAWCFSERM